MKTQKEILSILDNNFKDEVNEAINELFETTLLLREEYQKMMNFNSILMNTNNALKELLINKKIMTKKEFEKAYDKEMAQLRSQFQKHRKMQEELYIHHLLNNTQPGNS